MVVVVQRVSASSVRVEGEVVGSIAKGLTVLVGVMKGDSRSDVDKVVSKLVNLRIFADDAGKMNLSLSDIGGEVLAVSQFTLGASVKKGRRPSFEKAAPPAEAEALYDYFCEACAEHCPVQTGRFGAHMELGIENDGPVTIIIDSKSL